MARKSKRSKPLIFIRWWTYDPSRRNRRYRCVTCGKIVEDGSSIVIERVHGTSNTRSRAYHRKCWDATKNQPGSEAYQTRVRHGYVEDAA